MYTWFEDICHVHMQVKRICQNWCSGLVQQYSDQSHQILSEYVDKSDHVKM